MELTAKRLANSLRQFASNRKATAPTLPTPLHDGTAYNDATYKFRVFGNEGEILEVTVNRFK